MWELVFPSDEAPKTAENFLKRRYPIGYVRKLFRKSGVRVNGKRCRPREVLAPGDVLQIFIPFEARARARETGALEPKLDIVFENEELLVVNKAAGVAVHEGKGVRARDSLLAMAQAHLKRWGASPRLVHRLDRETSGLLVIAKNDSTAAELEREFENRRVDKEYLALVVGELRPSSGRIELPLPGRDGRPVPALTLYSVERRFAATTLARVRIQTGRMHQIRLHLARIGHPVVMDGQHGDFSFNKAFRKAHGLKRQFLHAAAIALTLRGRKWQWTAPLPADLSAVLDALEAESEAGKLH
ncbi:MAG TPA: RluA family pseudouridine synthase [Candidatus Acidoferrales bacterium]|nr:RluA family pseudouridine synthase [Candidatus Acidoferrales bacterium]